MARVRAPVAAVCLPRLLRQQAFLVDQCFTQRGWPAADCLVQRQRGRSGPGGPVVRTWMARPKVTSQIVAGRQARVVKVTPGPAAFRSCKPSSAGASFRHASAMRTTGSAAECALLRACQYRRGRNALMVIVPCRSRDGCRRRLDLEGTLFCPAQTVRAPDPRPTRPARRSD